MPPNHDSLQDRAIRAATQRLESLERAGVTHLGKPTMTAIPPNEPSTTTPSSGSVSNSDTPEATLAALADRVSKCTRCAELASSRTQTVFGVGNPRARLMFLGEAPGADEDRQGEPFVGRAGKLLTDIIEKGMRLKREDVYICNILRCRPPSNRNPSTNEAAQCREFLDAQIATVKPEMICCLGSIAATNLLDTTETIGKLRGRLLEYQSIPVVCTYHPAYLLRNPSAKKKTWEDIQLVMSQLGMEIPP